MIGKLTEIEIEEVLSEQIICRIGCHADDMTYVVPLSYAYDGKCVYARTFEGLKIDLMRKNPKVCFQVDVMEDMANWKSVIAWGDFKELTEVNERKEGIQRLLARKISGVASKTVQLSSSWPFSSEQDFNKLEGIIFSISLHEKSGRFEKGDSVIF